MRVTTAHAYDTTIAQLTKRQGELVAQQERISSGKRVARASDDPVAATMSEAVQNRLARVQTDQRALDASRTSIQQAESALGESGELIQKVRDLIIAGGNPTYGPGERESLAQEIAGLRDRLFSVANRQDGAGRNLFGGLGGSETPFVQTFGSGSAEVRFEGRRGQQAAGDNQLPQAMDGDAIWMRIPAGNGTFALDLPASNTGTVRSDTGQVTNLSALTGHDYQIDFSGTAGAMQYSVTDLTTGTPVAGQTGVAYSAGAQIAFDGMSFKVVGEPAAGDRLDLTSSSAPTDLFKVMQDAMDALRLGTGEGTQRTHDLGRALAELDAGHDRVLLARAQAGEWLNRADSIEGLLGDREVDHAAEQSQLEDLDLVKGISQFQSQQLGHEAALKSYAQVQRLSLFQYVG
ncbi:MAG: flagellar hook-associated protein FlgL [Hydrogenophaga sp.]|uniref:flagellar hook-associated protein FlgL n=1 Tax=Hydrogenophaga sp. TaxID=1904254 RepID=UPI0025BB470F|nr:flagellar hook-associated protein FlgL [Hydrogenophaga sp.]MBT9551802.1 flagellar hook-associated protein FlgL [Hydrogenophaga sp.]